MYSLLVTKYENKGSSCVYQKWAKLYDFKNINLNVFWSSSSKLFCLLFVIMRAVALHIMHIAQEMDVEELTECHLVVCLYI